MRAPIARLGIVALLASLPAGCLSLGPAALLPLNVEMPGGDVTVPLTEIADCFTVPVMINGRGPYNFEIDTGCGWTILSPEVEKQLNLQPLKIQEIAEMADGSKIESPQKIVRVSSLKVGSADYKDFYARLDSDGFFIHKRATPGGVPIMGILGAGILAKQPVTLDMPGKQLHIWQYSPLAGIPRSDPTLRPFKAADVVPNVLLTVAKGLPAQQTIEVTVDTGCWFPVVLPPSLAPAFDAAEPLREIQSRTLFGTPMVKLERHHTPIEYPGMVLTNNIVVFQKDGPVYAMGLPLLRHYAITLDGPQNLMRMELTDPPPPNLKMTLVEDPPAK